MHELVQCKQLLSCLPSMFAWIHVLLVLPELYTVGSKFVSCVAVSGVPSLHVTEMKSSNLQSCKGSARRSLQGI